MPYTPPLRPVDDEDLLQEHSLPLDTLVGELSAGAGGAKNAFKEALPGRGIPPDGSVASAGLELNYPLWSPQHTERAQSAIRMRRGRFKASPPTMFPSASTVPTAADPWQLPVSLRAPPNNT